MGPPSDSPRVGQWARAVCVSRVSREGRLALGGASRQRPRPRSRTLPLSPTTPSPPPQNGAWECVPDGANPPTRGTVLRQVVPAHPITWRPDETRPHTVLGSMQWRDVDASIDFRLAAVGDVALLAARCWIDGKASGAAPITAENAMAGVWLAVTQQAQWALYRNVANVSVAGAAVASGPLPLLVPGAWHTARLVVAGRTATAYLDGARLFDGVDVGWAAANGWVGVGTGDWGQHVDFDRVVVTT